MHSLGSEHRQERPLQPGRDSCRHGLSTGCVCWQRSVFGHLMPSSGTWVNFSWESPGWGHKKVCSGEAAGIAVRNCFGMHRDTHASHTGVLQAGGKCCCLSLLKEYSVVSSDVALWIFLCVFSPIKVNILIF